MESFIWRIINKIELFFRYLIILFKIKNADIILTATCAQTNLGDHAISIAEHYFFKNYMTEKKVVEIPKELYYKVQSKFYNRIGNDKIIVISGGGFLGNLWLSEEYFVRDVLNDFCTNKVIIFPQTIFFSDDLSFEYRKTFESYKNVKKLIINARDRRSFKILTTELQSCHVRYLPDMVLSLEYSSRKQRKNIGLLCFRSDKENCLTQKQIDSIISKLNKIKLKRITTIKKHIVPISFRKHEVNKILNEMSQAQIIITNRLHAMIFAAITATPCIAIDNVSHKVSGVYAWIKQLPYIKLLDNIENFEKVLSDLDLSKQYSYSSSYLNKYLIELRKEFYE